MRKIEDGGPAFPQLEVVDGERDGHGDLIEAYTVSKGGMTLRDYFAARALDPLGRAFCRISDGDWSAALAGAGTDNVDQFIATRAYQIADAMLAVCKKGGA